MNRKRKSTATALRAVMAIGAISTASTAFAGYTATTGLDAITIQNGSFDVFEGTFSSYVPDTANDPQIVNDLNRYGYTLSGNRDGSTFNYNGNYRIFYNTDGNNTYDDGTDISISFGDAFTTLSSIAFPGSTNFDFGTSTLTQTEGPQNPNFADLSYGGNPVNFSTTTLNITSSTAGVVVGRFRQDAVAAPVPASAGLALASVCGLGLMRRRRRELV